MEPKCLTADRFVDKNTNISYRYVFSQTEYFRPHYHDYFEMFLVLDGQVIHSANGEERRLSGGDLVFIRDRDVHDHRMEEGQTVSMLNFTFTADTLQGLFSYLGDGFPSAGLLAAPQPPQLHLGDADMKWMESQMDRIRSIEPGDHSRLKTALRTLLFRLFTRFFADLEPMNEAIPDWLEKMCTTMRENGNFAESTEFFFGLTDKTREHVSRCMKKYMGVTVTEYINSLRLNYIANMLRNSNQQISYIIFQSGFNNISWATELFRERYGMTMRAFRNLPAINQAEEKQ